MFADEEFNSARRATQRGRRHLSKDLAIGYGEAAEFGELVASRNLRDTGAGRIRAPQCRARHVQTPQQQILDGADAEEFGAAYPQGSFQYPYRRAKLGNGERLAGMVRKRILEPDHDIGVAFLPAMPGIVGSETIHERVNQFLLEGLRKPALGKRSILRFGKTTRPGMQTKQAPRRNRPRSQHPADRRPAYLAAGQRPAAGSELPCR
jgi:hypothetical protein